MKKQEEQVGTNEAEETLEQCMARVKSENPEMSEEAVQAQCTAHTEKQDHGCKEDEVWNAEQEKCVAKPAPAEKGLRDQILGVMKEYGDTLADQIRKDIEDKMKVVIKETRDEMVTSLRKGLGLEKDPVIHLSEMEGMVRKIILNKEPNDKRTLTKTGDKPAEGDGTPKKLESSEDIFKKLSENKGSI